MIAAAFAIGLVLVIVNGVFQPFVVLPPGAVRIPTSGFGPAELCTLQAATNPVHGWLSGDQSDPEWPVWISRPKAL
jgi:hypothetical protein